MSSAEVREWLAERGYDPQMGARPMARVIQEHIKKPLAEELLFGRLAQGGKVRVGVEPTGSCRSISKRRQSTETGRGLYRSIVGGQRSR